jgi:hypothetical protein
MPPEIAALLAKPVLLAAVLAIGAICGVFTERMAEKLARAERRAKWAKRSGFSGLTRPRNTSLRAVTASQLPEKASFDAAEQLRVVMEANFKASPLLNAPERRLLTHLDRALAEEAPGWRAMGQVSLGEILLCRDQVAYSAINSKRVDLLLVDDDCRPLHAIEFQGTGHYQGTAAARDAVKKEALRRAGIGYVEIVSGDTPADVRAMVRKLVARSEAR